MWSLMEENGNVLECGVHGRPQCVVLEKTMGLKTQIKGWVFPRDSNVPSGASDGPKGSAGVRQGWWVPGGVGGFGVKHFHQQPLTAEGNIPMGGKSKFLVSPVLGR